MYRVSKVLNNNGVIAIDMDENKEYVILGKGVGFGKKVSQRFDAPADCTIYRLAQETERGSAKELAKSVAPEFLEIADEILKEAEKTFGDTIDKGIIFPLADHISFAVGRIRNHEQISNPLTEDIKVLFYSEFKVAEVLQIQNLLENMIYSLVTGRGDQNRINQTTMGLIFLYLLESVQYAEMRLPNQYENMIAMTTLDYIEQQYRTATLTELCEQLHLPMHMLSKMIKKNTGFNFKELLQRKRLNKAVELMCETDLPISDIIAAVGYENGSYFHRVFKERYHTTPRAFRVANDKEERVRL